MWDILLFIGALFMVIAHALFLVLVVKIRARQWALSTAVLLVLVLILPPAGFSSVIIILMAVASCFSHWWVRQQTAPALLTVRRGTDMQENPGKTEVTPFPAMQSGPPANDYEGMGRPDDDDDPAFDRGKHSTKRAGSKRVKKKGHKGKGKTAYRPTSTSDLPTAEKPTIEEYLRPREDFFNDD
jgi:hypothetical protein